MSVEPKRTEEKFENSNVQYGQDHLDKKVNLNDLLAKMKVEKKKEQQNNIILSAAAVSAVAVVGIILTL
tara:strand:+ start:181 stop:387 length:207 start_codon:yes stop_codon:yes gene_type:complete